MITAIAFWGGLLLADLASTSLALRNPYVYESHPYARRLEFRLPLTAGFVATDRWVERRWGKKVWIVRGAAGLVMGYVVAKNLQNYSN